MYQLLSLLKIDGICKPSDSVLGYLNGCHFFAARLEKIKYRKIKLNMTESKEIERKNDKWDERRKRMRQRREK
jgi:hypothetical protein